MQQLTRQDVGPSVVFIYIERTFLLNINKQNLVWFGNQTKKKQTREEKFQPRAWSYEAGCAKAAAAPAGRDEKYSEFFNLNSVKLNLWLDH